VPAFAPSLSVSQSFDSVWLVYLRRDKISGGSEGRRLWSGTP
jgi:hypothetical protein